MSLDATQLEAQLDALISEAGLVDEEGNDVAVEVAVAKQKQLAEAASGIESKDNLDTILEVSEYTATSTGVEKIEIEPSAAAVEAKDANDAVGDILAEAAKNPEIKAADVEAEPEVLSAGDLASQLEGLLNPGEGEKKAEAAPTPEVKAAPVEAEPEALSAGDLASQLEGLLNPGEGEKKAEAAPTPEVKAAVVEAEPEALSAGDLASQLEGLLNPGEGEKKAEAVPTLEVKAAAVEAEPEVLSAGDLASQLEGLLNPGEGEKKTEAAPTPEVKAAPVAAAAPAEEAGGLMGNDDIAALLAGAGGDEAAAETVAPEVKAAAPVEAAAPAVASVEEAGGLMGNDDIAALLAEAGGDEASAEAVAPEVKAAAPVETPAAETAVEGGDLTSQLEGLLNQVEGDKDAASAEVAKQADDEPADLTAQLQNLLNTANDPSAPDPVKLEEAAPTVVDEPVVAEAAAPVAAAPVEEAGGLMGNDDIAALLAEAGDGGEATAEPAAEAVAAPAVDSQELASQLEGLLNQVEGDKEAASVEAQKQANDVPDNLIEKLKGLIELANDPSAPDPVALKTYPKISKASKTPETPESPESPKATEAVAVEEAGGLMGNDDIAALLAEAGGGEAAAPVAEAASGPAVDGQELASQLEGLLNQVEGDKEATSVEAQKQADDVPDNLVEKLRGLIELANDPSAPDPEPLAPKVDASIEALDTALAAEASDVEEDDFEMDGAFESVAEAVSEAAPETPENPETPVAPADSESVDPLVAAPAAVAESHQDAQVNANAGGDDAAADQQLTLDENFAKQCAQDELDAVALGDESNIPAESLSEEAAAVAAELDADEALTKSAVPEPVADEAVVKVRRGAELGRKVGTVMLGAMRLVNAPLSMLDPQTRDMVGMVGVQMGLVAIVLVLYLKVSMMVAGVAAVVLTGVWGTLFYLLFIKSSGAASNKSGSASDDEDDDGVIPEPAEVDPDSLAA